MFSLQGKTRTLWRTAAVLVAVILAVAFVAGCGGGDDDQSPAARETATPTDTEATTTAPATPGVFTIAIENSTFSHLAVPTGTQITVVNHDDVEHTVTSDRPGLFDVEVQPHAEQVFTAPANPGTYRYHCTYHPAMQGELVVE